jgi:hypothetical protein
MFRVTTILLIAKVPVQYAAIFTFNTALEGGETAQHSTGPSPHVMSYEESQWKEAQYNWMRAGTA